jgi:hypothetical protein
MCKFQSVLVYLFHVLYKTEDLNFISFIVLLFIYAYKAWVISSPCPHPLPYHALRPLPLPPPPQYPAETILPLSLTLLRREYKQ